MLRTSSLHFINSDHRADKRHQNVSVHITHRFNAKEGDNDVKPFSHAEAQRCCVQFPCHSRNGLLGEHILTALESHDVELVSIAARSVVSHDGCNSTALRGRNCKSCWRWLTWKGTEATGVAKRGDHEHGLAVVTRFGVTSPLLFVLFVVLFEDFAGGNSGPGRNVSVEQQCGLPRDLSRMAFLLRVSPFTRITALVSTYRAFFKSAHLRHLTIYLRFSIERRHGKSRAKCVTAQVFLVALSWLRLVRTWRHFQCPRVEPHTRRIHVVGFVTLEPSLLVGSLAAMADREPLSRCAHVLPKHAFRTRVLVAFKLQDKIVADTRREVHEVLYSVLASNKSLLSTVPLSDGCNHHGSER